MLYLCNIFTLIIVAASFFLFKQVAGSMSFKKLNMISWLFYYYILIYVIIGSILILNGFPTIMVKYLSNSDKFYAWFAIIYSLIALPIGMLISKACFSGKTTIKESFHNYLARGFEHSKNEGYYFGILFCITIIFFAYLIIYLHGIPVLKFCLGNLSVVQGLQLRHFVESELTGFAHFSYKFVVFLAPVLSYASYFYWKERQSMSRFLFFLVTFCMAIFALTFNLNKAPVLLYLLGFLFTAVFLKKKVNILKMIILVLVCFILAALFFVVLKKMDIYIAIKSIFSRIFIAQIEGTFAAFHLYPHIIPFSYERRSIISQIITLKHSFIIPREIMTYYAPIGVYNKTSGQMSSYFLQEAWGAFGFVGIVLSPIWVGFIIESLYIFFLRQKKTPLLAAGFVYFSVYSIINGSFIGYIFNKFYLLLISFLILFVMLVRFLKSLC
jgi:hypothetical protein